MQHRPTDYDSNHNVSPCHALIHQHVDVARRIARKFGRRLPPSISRDEVEGAALLGLTEAASRYDESRGEPFIGYAVKRIRGAIQDELRRADPLTRRARRHVREVSEATRILEHLHGGCPPLDKVAGMVGRPTREVLVGWECSAAMHAVALDELPELPAAPGEGSPHAAYERLEQEKSLSQAIACLPERDRRILSMSYGEGRTLKEIGARLGISESRVSQLRTHILQALRNAMTGTESLPDSA
jgi:RNA polymerase sigma factor FliA